MKLLLDVWYIIRVLKDPNKKEWNPKIPEEKEENVEREIFAGDIKKYMKHVTRLKDNCCILFAVLFDHCSESPQAKLRKQNNWHSIDENNNLLKLLKRTEVWIVDQDKSRNPLTTVETVLVDMYRVRQNKHELLTEYCCRFTVPTTVLNQIEL